jgi:hypothetical protein
VRGSDVQWIGAQWAVSGTIAHQMLTKLTGEIGLSRREVREYLSDARRGTHAAFHGLDKANYPLGAACTLERVQPWRASRAPRPAPEIASTERRAPRGVPCECGATLRVPHAKSVNVQCRVCGVTTFVAANMGEVLGELVKRVGEQ